MWIFVVVCALILILLFGLSSMSQSYAAAKQAQAVIETARVAQIASLGNLVIIIALVILLLAAIGVIAYLLLRTETQPRRQWAPGPNAHWEQLPQPSPNALLPTLLTMLMYQMMPQQQQQDHEHYWLMQEPANQDIPALPDQPWDM
jgi:amino acid transporter